MVYDILRLTTATADYNKCLEKLSANGQFFVDAQMAVNLCQIDNSNYIRRFIYNRRRCLCQHTEFSSCVKVEVAVLGFPSLTSLMVSVEVKQH